jgi:thiosulfate/3-mercaptopyruvate sulfurtransferase
MNSEILLSAQRLNELISGDGCLVVDCRFDLVNPGKGKAAWLTGHIPGAAYAHLDDDLAAPVQLHTGRHPLPEPARFAEFLASAGWSDNKLLVAYDEGSNAISSRLWWMMRYFGKRAALLDGGFQAWLEAGLPLETGAPSKHPSAPQQLTANPHMIVSADFISQRLGSADAVVLDARAPERYSGEVEPLDTRAGHMPGALNRPFSENLDGSGRFREARELKAEFESLLGKTNAKNVIHSCGSGVTACHNLFAMELAGLDASCLYPGSWSHWIRDPDRPVVTGEAC